MPSDEQPTTTIHLTKQAQRLDLLERIDERADERGATRNQCILEAMRFWLAIDEILEGRAAYWENDVGDDMRFEYFSQDFRRWVDEVADQ